MKKYFSHICSNLTDFVKEIRGHTYKNNLQMRAAQIGNPPNLEYVYLPVVSACPLLIYQNIFFTPFVCLLLNCWSQSASAPNPAPTLPLSKINLDQVYQNQI